MAKLKIEVELDLQTWAIQVKGPLEQKPLVCNALARAISAVIEHAQPVIRPVKNGNGHPPLVIPKG